MIWCAVVFIHVCVCVNSCHFFSPHRIWLFGTTGTKMVLLIYLFSVHIGSFFPLLHLHIFFFIFILSSTFLLVCFCHTGEIKLKKKPQCVCQWWSQRICYFDCRYFSILIPNAKAFVICFDLCLMLFFMYALRINNG